VDLAALMGAHQAGVWRFLRVLGCDVASADDLTQETFLAVYRAGFEDRGEKSTRAYLRVVAKNTFLKSKRNAGKVITVEELERIETEWSALAEDGGDAMTAALRQCLEKLEARPRQALNAFYGTEKSREQVAKDLGMTDDGLKSLLRRTRELLKECIERRVK
jgi:RNA polymerase sigma-70 factor (ECF subfamily)